MVPTTPRAASAATASFADLADNTIGFIGASAEMHQNLRAGAAASASALARPMPREAPVTSAVFPVRLCMIVCFAV